MTLVLSVSTLAAAPSYSQQTKMDVSYKQESLRTVLNDLRQRSGSQIVFVVEEVAGKNQVTLTKKAASLEEILNDILPQNGLTYTVKDDVVVITRSEKTVAQQPAMITVTGRVADEKGNPLTGVSVMVNQTTRGAATDANGRYRIQAKPDDALKFSYVGYIEQTIALEGKTTVNVSLRPKVETIKEVTITAYGARKKESVTAAITTVNPDLLRSSSSDLTSTFAGRVPGMIAWQTAGLPAALTEDEMNTQFYIRGITSFQEGANTSPLIVLDGVESSKLDLARISPYDIESFSVLKDAQATSLYGARGANGVILVTTKKGVEGNVYTTFRYESIVSMPTREVEVVDPLTYMSAYNQALLARDATASPKYSVEHIERAASGRYPSFVYPLNDWYDMMFKSMTINQHFGLTARGGGKIVQYYASFNHNRDRGTLKADRLNDFDPNIRNNQTTFRMNLNIDLRPNIKLIVNSNASLDKYHGPRIDANQAYYLAFQASPVDFAALYPGDEMYGWERLRFGVPLGTSTAETDNPYWNLQRGYKDRTRYSATNRAEYIQNLSSLVKGLELRASVAMTQTGYYQAGFYTSPGLYSLDNYDFETGLHTLKQFREGSRALTVDRDLTASQAATQMTYDARLMHNAAWGGSEDERLHQTAVTAVFNVLESSGYPIGSILLGLPHRNVGFSMLGTYGFKNRYFVEGSFGYNASERFHEDNRWGFFPAVGGAWVVSNEKWMRSVNKVIPYMKLRASWGKVGNDGIINTPRFVYLPEIAEESRIHPKSGTSDNLYRYIVNTYGNPNIQWEIAEQANLGLDLTMLKGLLEFNVDAYQEIRHNIISYRTTIPATVGIEKWPLDNIGKTRSRGIDFSGKIQHSFGKDLWFILNGTFTYNKTVYKELEESADTPAWQRKVGKEISQKIGFIAEGLFKDYTEIANAPRQDGNTMPGDIRYKDINGDGVIDINDATYIGYPTTPRVIYGLNGTLFVKGFEFNFTFQGSGKRGFFINADGISPFTGNRAMLKAIYDDHWSDDNMTTRPFWPRLSTQNITEHNPQEKRRPDESAIERYSTYFMRECWFVRCSSLELAYNVPNTLMRKLKLHNGKIYVRTNNPFIINDFKLWDVELGGNGFNYPIQRTYAIGINLSF